MEKEMLSIPTESGHSALVYACLVLVCLLYILIFSYYQEQSKRLLSASVNSKTKSTLSRIDSETINKVGRYMNLLFFINVLLFVYAAAYRYHLYERLSTFQLTFIIIGILCLFLLKYFSHFFLALVFKTQHLAKQYLEELYLKLKLCGILLFPLILLLLFSPKYATIAVSLGILAYSLIWIIMAFFSIKLGLMSKSFPKYYPFLYICTLEILPLALLGKIFQAPLTGLFGL